MRTPCKCQQRPRRELMQRRVQRTRVERDAVAQLTRLARPPRIQSTTIINSQRMIGACSDLHHEPSMQRTQQRKRLQWRRRASIRRVADAQLAVPVVAKRKHFAASRQCAVCVVRRTPRRSLRRLPFASTRACRTNRHRRRTLSFIPIEFATLLAASLNSLHRPHAIRALIM
jgi:hypothetical protein